MEPPTTKKGAQRLTGRLASLNRFISRSAERNLPFFEVLKSAEVFQWGSIQQKAFEELARGRTVLLIAHRLTTVMNADVICVMDGGSIVESGRHADLIDMNGRYRAMWDDYQKALSWKVKGVVA